MVDQINHHLYRKRGFYYFSRRVPKALLDDYPKPRIVLALKTRHYRDALRQSQILSKRLDDQWFHMQLDAMGLDNVQSKLFQQTKATAPLMSEATVFYLKLKGDGKDFVFTRAAQRNANIVIEVLGDKPINEYASSEAGKLRDVLLNNRRRIPDDLKGHHDGLSFFVQSLKTHEAAKGCNLAIECRQKKLCASDCFRH